MIIIQKIMKTVVQFVPDKEPDPLIRRKHGYIGTPVSRVDGQLKVEGAAKFSAEYKFENLAFATVVCSTIAKGKITRIDKSKAEIDKSKAEAATGVIAFITYKNAPPMKDPERYSNSGGGSCQSDLPVLRDERIYWNGQPVACVVAETQDRAERAAQLVRAEYEAESAALSFDQLKAEATPPPDAVGQPATVEIGDAAEKLKTAEVVVDNFYRTPRQNHNALEPHGGIAVWTDDESLTVFDETQSLYVVKKGLAGIFDLAEDKVRVVAPFVGGGFGGKGYAWTHNFLAVMAAQVIKRPVKLAVTRQMMQTNVGRRSETSQQFALGAGTDGKLLVIRHHTDTYNNLTQFFEPVSRQTEILHAAPTREISYRVAKPNVGAPTYMRSPGEAVGPFTSESAMDELTYELKIDPLELRVRNHTAVDPLKKLPFSGENLLECYRTGAERFGWARRKNEPRQAREGNYLIGYGMATATYGALRSSATVRIEMTADGWVKVLCATQDLGTGTYTICAQAAADALGVSVEKITVELGDSSLPPGVPSFGSVTAASVIPAVVAASEMLRADLLKLAITDRQSKLFGRNAAEINFADQKFFVVGDAGKSDSYIDIMRRNAKTKIKACATAMPASGPGLGAPGASCLTAPAQTESNSDNKKYSFNSFGAQFVEVRVDEQLGVIRIVRVVSVHDVGRVLNEKTARSQIIGGVIFSLGSALMEESRYDPRFASPAQRTLADYHVPVNLDVPEIEVHFINKPDAHIPPIGARGAGEIGGVGISAAIANAIFNQTGKRIRELPITLDKLL